MASISELWLVDFRRALPGGPSSARPALVVGPPDTFGRSFPVVFVMPLTTARLVASHVGEASEMTGLEDTSYIQCEMLRSVNGQRLVHRLGAVGWEVMDQVSFNIGTLLDQP
ncbi:MAG: type II toxin-antitoxin system PemK/MazF family toxin [Candidatus Microthrix sp.]|nr:type II toxin-antitoxin system PemK/MazF family toxin [Candidatus Microthrix sp.]MBK7322603.1 type II toxin-antitoxin system PemK/MazF family toxin [Candidatus Microthrix sp.]